jgi:ATP-dependent exoDNAse (exonuclease V) beta subunit
MTIHKSKGLEFEVVVIPELQAGSRRGKFTLISWLERGRAPQLEDTDVEQDLEITEFLVAPLQSKGADRGEAKKWVDGVRREREKQEMRRLLYVAATRAREALHIFARPEFKSEKSGSLELVVPKDSLLATAWPAFEAEIRKRFAEWKTASSEELVELAAAQASDDIAPPDGNRPTLIRRLPADFAITTREVFAPSGENTLVGTGDPYQRHEGGLISRALGNAVHGLLQHLAQNFTDIPFEVALASLPDMRALVARRVRAVGVDAKQASRIAEQAISIARDAANHPTGRWILSPQSDAASEVRWAGIVDGVVRTVQIDRVFRAGPTPESAAEGAADSTWWIIDYKTASGDEVDPAVALSDLRRIFAPQLQTYARVLRNLKGANASICAGLYYPRMGLFDWSKL